MENTGNVADKIKEYQELKDQIKALSDEEKALNEVCSRLESEIIADMTDASEDMGITLDKFKIGVDDKTYGIQRKQHFNILAADRDIVFSAMREVGLGHLIVAKVDSRSLSKELRERAEMNRGQLPPEIASIPWSTYEETVLVGRKTGRKGDK